jgi:MFS family permease
VTLEYDLSLADIFKSGGNRALLVLIAGVLMAALDISIVGPALPAIRFDFGIGDRDVVWIFNSYVLLYMIGTPLMAKLSEIFGQRNIYILDIALFGLGSMIVSAAPSFPVLLAGRAIQGFGAGGIFPVAVASIASAFPPGMRGRALGALGSVFSIAFILGPLLGGALLAFSWKLFIPDQYPVCHCCDIRGL